MKKFKLAVLMLILIGTLTACHSFDLQYRNENGDLITECFKSRKEFNDRAAQLTESGTKYWLSPS
jgi:hypothetical protein